MEAGGGAVPGRAGHRRKRKAGRGGDPELGGAEQRGGSQGRVGAPDERVRPEQRRQADRGGDTGEPLALGGQ